MTLVELLVVIVILVTLVGGVLPLLSPNNDARRLQAASRNLQTYLQKAQTKAMRSGRPVGVAFRETQPGSGFALEAFQVQVPAPFRGFSSTATARFQPVEGQVYYAIEFGEGTGSNFRSGDLTGINYIPPRMVRDGDLIEVGKSVFRLKIRQGEDDKEAFDETGLTFYLPTWGFKQVELISGPSPPTTPLKVGEDIQVDISPNNVTSSASYSDKYAISRQPIISSASPLTFPNGVAVDLSASGIEGGATPTLFAGSSGGGLKQVTIMFSPTGGTQEVQYNGMKFDKQLVLDDNNSQFIDMTGESIRDARYVKLLLATVEKSGLDLGSGVGDWYLSAEASSEDVDQARKTVSWLDLNSRWIEINARSGQARVSEVTFVDPRNYQEWEGRGIDPPESAFEQILEARRSPLKLTNVVDP